MGWTSRVVAYLDVNEIASFAFSMYFKESFVSVRNTLQCTIMMSSLHTVSKKHTVRDTTISLRPRAES